MRYKIILAVLITTLMIASGFGSTYEKDNKLERSDEANFFTREV